jgi:hypothetical protein
MGGGVDTQERSLPDQIQNNGKQCVYIARRGMWYTIVIPPITALHRHGIYFYQS